MWLWSGRKVIVCTNDGYRNARIVERLTKDRYRVASIKNPAVTWTALKWDISLG